MPKNHYVSETQLIVIGRRYGSDDVALEAGEAIARWRRDLAVLGGYGLGQAALDAFVADAAEQTKLRAARPEAVAGKKMSVVARDKQVSAGWAWVDRVGSMLGVLARTDQTLSMALASATPRFAPFSIGTASSALRGDRIAKRPAPVAANPAPRASMVAPSG
jgi:hypothetical protein